MLFYLWHMKQFQPFFHLTSSIISLMSFLFYRLYIPSSLEVACLGHGLHVFILVSLLNLLHVLLQSLSSILKLFLN